MSSENKYGRANSATAHITTIINKRMCIVDTTRLVTYNIFTIICLFNHIEVHTIWRGGPRIISISVADPLR